MKYVLTIISFFLLLSGIAQSPRFIYPELDVDDVEYVEFSKENKYFLTTTDQSIQVVELETGRLLYRIAVNYTGNAVFTPDGEGVVYSINDKKTLLDIKTGKRTVYEEAKQTAGNQQDNPAKKYYTTISRANGYEKPDTLNIWSWPAKERVAQFTDYSSDVQLSTDGNSIYYKTPGALLKRELPGGKVLESISDLPVYRMIIGPGQRTISSYRNDTVFTRTAGKTGIRYMTGHPKEISYIFYNTSGTLLLSYSYDGTAIIWDPATGKMINRINHIKERIIKDSKEDRLGFLTTTKYVLVDFKNGHFIDSVAYDSSRQANPSAMAFSGNGKYFSVADWSNITIHREHKAPLQLKNNAHFIQGAVVSPDSRYILSNGRSDFRLWDTKENRPIGSWSNTRDNSDAEFSADGKSLMVWDGREFDLLRIPDLKYAYGIRNPRRGKVFDAFISNDQKRVGLVSRYEIMIWGNSGDTLIREIPIPDNDVIGSARFSPNGKYTLLANRDSAFLFLTDTGIVYRRFLRTAADSLIFHVYSSSNDKYFMTHSRMHDHATVWDISSGKRLYTIAGNNPQFTPDAKYIFAGNRLFDPATGLELNTSENIRISPGPYSSTMVEEKENVPGMIRIENKRSGRQYYLLVLGKDDYLVFDDEGHYDGSEKARNELNLACGGKILPHKEVEQLYVPGLVQKILSGEKITGKKLSDLEKCD